jgi:hypothetical protein
MGVGEGFPGLYLKIMPCPIEKEMQNAPGLTGKLRSFVRTMPKLPHQEI